MDEHHIFCNGDWSKPIVGCRWCDGPNSLWLSIPYHMDWCICLECIGVEHDKHMIRSGKSMDERIAEGKAICIQSYASNCCYPCVYCCINAFLWQEDPEVACVCDTCGCGCPCLCGCLSCCPFTGELDEESEIILRKNLWDLYTCSTCQGDPFLQPCEDCGNE